MQKEIVQEITIFIKANVLYLVAMVIFLALLLGYVPKTMQSIVEVNNKIKTEQNALTKLQAQYAIITKYESFDLPVLWAFVNKLVPDKGDSFSIHTTLDLLASVTGYAILSKNVPADFTGKQENIPVTVTIKGSIDNLSKILSDHMFQYGRFFIIKQVDISPKDDKVTLQLQFYSQLSPQSKDVLSSLNAPDMLTLEHLSNEIKKNQTAVILNTNEEEYIPSQSPFGTTVPPNLKKP